MAEAGKVLLRVRGLSKTFPSQVALSGVDLDVRSGEVHAVVGENGSGKSTLIKTLAGYHEPDPGGLVELPSAHAGGGGVGFVHQNLALVDTLNALDNLALGRGYSLVRGKIDRRRELERAEALMARMGRRIDLEAPLVDLTPVERALVAMARALDGLTDSSVLVLDEPTAALPTPEVGRLFVAIEELKSRGGGVLYVSHRLDEVFEIADRVTVLRDGNVIATVDVSELDRDGLIELMLGHALDKQQPSRRPRSPGGPAALKVDGLSGGTVVDFSIEIQPGEIVGVAGLVGSGREHLAQAMVGGLPKSSGRVTVGTNVVTKRNPRAAIDAGLALVPADRPRFGAFLEHSVAENITLPRLATLLRRFRMQKAKELTEVRDWIDRVDIRPGDPDMVLGALSGGNQQKAVLARWLRARPTVLILDEPTQGVDVGAKELIHGILRDAAADGLGLLICSAESEDLVGLCDRVLVMRRGRVEASLEHDELSNNRIMKETSAPALKEIAEVSL